MSNEKRLIDANALKANFVVLGEFAKDLWHAGTIRMAIDNAHTVDAVEVVRCKDCEYCGHFDGLLYCDNIRGLAGSVSPEAFCSYGERRTE